MPENDPSADFTVASDPALLAEGWERRNLADPSRIDEIRELYESLGYEVRAEPLNVEAFGPECASCALSVCKTYALIYTRK